MHVQLYSIYNHVGTRGDTNHCELLVEISANGRFVLLCFPSSSLTDLNFIRASGLFFITSL